MGLLSVGGKRGKELGWRADEWAGGRGRNRAAREGYLRDACSEKNVRSVGPSVGWSVNEGESGRTLTSIMKRSSYSFFISFLPPHGLSFSHPFFILWHSLSHTGTTSPAPEDEIVYYLCLICLWGEIWKAVAWDVSKERVLMSVRIPAYIEVLSKVVRVGAGRDFRILGGQSS